MRSAPPGLEFLSEQAVRALERLVDERVVQVLAGHDLEGSRGRWLVGAKAAAAYLGCSPKRIYNRLHELPHVRDGGRIVFHTDDLDAYLRSR